jgi:uncharacterized membrane protein
MATLVLASLFLPLSHFLIASTSLRDWLVRQLGERRYSGAYSLLAVAAFVWLIFAYHYAPASPLWQTPQWIRLPLIPFMLLSSVLVIAGLTTPNPVIVRSQRLFGNPDIVRGILRISRNPFFWGMSLFAISHVIMIGDMTANLAFGSVVVLGFAGAPILDAKKARQHGADWQPFAAVTSDIPFLAIVQGRQRLALGEIGWWRLSLGVALFAVALLFHRTLFGGDIVAIIFDQVRP